LITKKKININPGAGFGEIQFGMYCDSIESFMGLPEYREDDEEEDKLYSYKSFGIDLLCFEKEENFKLTMIELNNDSNAYLWGYEIFELPLEQIKSLAKKNDHNLIGNFDLERPQNLYQIKPLSMDFYFSKSGILE
jgi:hypothetical protein